MSDYRLRQGHHDPRNLWRHHIDETPESKSGMCVGRVDYASLAAEIVAAVNASRGATDPDAREAEVLATELADERTLHQQTLATLARVRADLLAEIDDMDPDHTMRQGITDDTDHGHPGNSWWRTRCEVGGMMRALAVIDGSTR